jgi:transposase InsO family protein
METHLRAELIIAALDMAIAQRRPVAVIHPSDRSCPYTNYAFGKRCREAGVRPSTEMGQVQTFKFPLVIERGLAQPSATSE